MARDRVVCIGNLCADAIVRPVDMAKVERGKLHLMDAMSLHTGGCAANPSVDMARMGVPVAVMGRVGEDGFGRFVHQTLAEEGVDITGLRMLKEVPTSASVVMLDASGERTFLHCLGSNATLCEDDIDFSLMDDVKYLFIAAMLTPALDGEPAARVFQKAQAQGMVTLMDTAWDQTGRWMSAVGPCLPYVDYFLPSIEEAEMISGLRDVPAMAAFFMEKGAGKVAIKLGAQGCYIHDGQREAYITGYKVDAVDTTGAGDSWVAGFITGLRQGWDMEVSARFANAVGAHCVMAVGASAGIKPVADIVAFMEAHRS